MLRKVLSAAAGFLLGVGGMAGSAAETLHDVLQASGVPTERFSSAELDGKITSYAISKGEPLLLAYFSDYGSGQLRPPLHVIRYGRTAGDLRLTNLQDINALFQGGIPMDCLGSAVAIEEYGDTIYIDTHLTPSAGCVIVLSSHLAFRTALSGWLLGVLGSDYAIVRGSEIHFMSVHPLHISVFDVKRSRAVEVYPYRDDPQRSQFSKSIEPHISGKWCMEHNAQCDPDNFDADVKGNIIANAAAHVFGFEAEFDAGGFGDAAEKQVPPRTVFYVYRERGGLWEHREFQGKQLQQLLGGMSIEELVSQRPDLPFQTPAGK